MLTSCGNNDNSTPPDTTALTEWLAGKTVSAEAVAKYSQEPFYPGFPYFPVLMLYEPDLKQNPINGVHLLYNRVIEMGPETQYARLDMSHWGIGDAEIKNGKAQWTRYEQTTYYAAIVEKRY